MRILFVILFTFFLYANEQNGTEQNKSIDFVKLNQIRSEYLDFKKKNSLEKNEWIKTYSAYLQHKSLLDKKKSLEKEIATLKHLGYLSKKQKEQLKKLKKRLKIIEDKIALVKDFEKEPFKKLIAPPNLADAPKITNPFALINGLSFIKELHAKKANYKQRYDSLIKTIQTLKHEKNLLIKIYAINKNPLEKEHIIALDKEIKELETISDIFKTTRNIFEKKAEEIESVLQSEIKRELEKIVYIAIILGFLLGIFFFLKYLAFKYFSKRESFYTINKVINISFITLVVLILLFAYLENVNYLITILGFASAGIAIAMKDWFMSLMGWFVIVLGGAIHVGDRIKVVKNGVEYVGDVIDISLLRITIFEDITLTTYMQNRRAGRIIFVPNNYIFTDLIANYSHSGLKTVWDGIDIDITFDSNIQKAQSIAKNIAKQYAKGYTDITRKQLNRLRSKYHLKNANVEPRIFAFYKGYGITISIWYLTNAYATLTLRSTISMKVIEAYQQSDDITLAFPAQSLYLNKSIPKVINDEKESIL